MIDPPFIFTIFMLTLGPMKTVPAFFAITQDRPPAAARVLALKGTGVATAVSLLIAVVMTGVAAAWHISSDDVRHDELSGARLDFCGPAGRPRGGCGRHLAAQPRFVPADALTGALRRS